MKVKDFINKVNYGSSKLPVYLQEGLNQETRRKVESFDYAGYYYDEKDRTLVSVSLDEDKVVVYYK